MFLASVTVPIGQYGMQAAVWFAEIVIPCTSAVALYLAREVPGWLIAYLKENLTQVRIERAVNWGLTQIDHELIDPATGKPRTIDLSTGNELADMAIGYMEMYAPTVAAELGARLKPRILAQIAKVGAAPAAPMPNPLPAKPIPQTTK